MSCCCTFGRQGLLGPPETIKIGIVAHAPSDYFSDAAFQEIKDPMVNVTLTICKSLRLNCVFEEVLTNIFGMQDHNGSWSGFLGMLKEGRYNTSLPIFTLTEERTRDFGYPIIGFFEPQILITRDSSKEVVSAFHTVLKPIKSETWVAIMIILLLLSFVIAFPTKRFALRQSVLKYSVDVFLVLLVNLARKGQKLNHLQLQTKLLLTLWGLVTIVIIASYTCGLLSAMIHSPQSVPFHNFKGFVQCVESKRCSYIDKGRTRFLIDILQSTPDSPLYYKLKIALQTNPIIEVHSFNEMISLIKATTDKFLVARLPGSFLLSKDSQKDLMIVQYDTELQTYIFRKNDPLKNLFEKQLLQLDAAGVMNKIYSKRETGDHESSNEMGVSPIPLSSLISLFFLFCCGIILSFISLLSEWISKRRTT